MYMYAYIEKYMHTHIIYKYTVYRKIWVNFSLINFSSIVTKLPVDTLIPSVFETFHLDSCSVSVRVYPSFQNGTRAFLQPIIGLKLRQMGWERNGRAVFAIGFWRQNAASWRRLTFTASLLIKKEEKIWCGRKARGYHVLGCSWRTPMQRGTRNSLWDAAHKHTRTVSSSSLYCHYCQCHHCFCSTNHSKAVGLILFYIAWVH